MKNQAVLQKHGSTEEIGQSANLLADALVRLSPDARFALLRRLAGSDDPQSPDQEAATEALAGQLDDRFIVQTMASALMDRQGDASAVRAIGNVLRRLRPVEAERRRLLDGVDATLEKKGKRLDGVLWQEMQSRAFDDKTLGMLELAISQSKEELLRYSTARMKGQLPEFAGQDILHATGGGVEEFWAAGTLVQMLQERGAPSEGFVARCVEMTIGLDDNGAHEEALDMLQTLMARAGAGDAPVLADSVRQLLDGERGRRWSAALLERGGGDNAMMGELLLSALEGATDRATQESLIARLGELSPAAFLQLTADRIATVDPLRVQHILRAALRVSPSMAVKLARIVLKYGAARSKEVALKTLVESSDRDVVALLAHVAGWKGEKQVMSLLGVMTADEKRSVHKLQLIAVGALGPHAVAARGPPARGDDRRHPADGVQGARGAARRRRAGAPDERDGTRARGPGGAAEPQEAIRARHLRARAHGAAQCRLGASTRGTSRCASRGRTTAGVCTGAPARPGSGRSARWSES